jgi:hypothetical protein
MNVLMRMAAAHGGGIDVIGIELKYLGLLMVYPNDYVLVAAHSPPQ